MPKIDYSELAAGLIVVAIGAFFFFAAYDYRMGTVARMGPGFVPHVLGAVGLLLGAIVAMGAIGRAGVLPAVAWRPLGAVLVAILAFALLLERAGLVPTLLIVTAIAMTGNPNATPRMILTTALAVTALCWAIFVAFIGLPMPTFWFD